MGLIAYFTYVRTHTKRKIQGPVLSARFLDADYGNAVIFRTPEAKTIVIDPVSGRGVKALGNLLNKEQARNITVILTDPTADSAAALAALQESIGVSKVIRPELGNSTKAWNRRMKTAECERIENIAIAGGDKYKLSKKTIIEALSPIREDKLIGHESSLVFKVRFGKKSFFFPSQISVDEESYLIRSGQDLTGSVLIISPRAPYRGISLELLSMVRPEVIVAGASRNLSDGAIENLNSHNTGAALFLSDKDGIIQIDTNGRSIQVVTEEGEPR